jgi:hypothetical protein
LHHKTSAVNLARVDLSCVAVAATVPPPSTPPNPQLESGTVDDELTALKKGLLGSGSSGNGPVAALPEGRPVKDAIDMELEELRKKARE